MALRKSRGELVGIIKSLDIILRIAGVAGNPKSKGQTKDLSKKRCLSRLCSKKSNLKIELA